MKGKTSSSISKTKKRFFFFLMITIPILLLVVMEMGLRIIKYGPDLSLFTEIELNGTNWHVLNPSIRARYFSENVNIPIQSTDYFLVPKPQNTYRIFCLGGSTATGYPYWYNASFSFFLKTRLQIIFPDKNIEVINLSMTAVNSFTVLDMVKELPEYEPDLILVYDGHNEFYGPLGVASKKFMFGSRSLNFVYLSLLESKLFLLLRDGYNYLLKFINEEPKVKEQEITLELLARGQHIPYGSEIYKEGLKIFEANLLDLQSFCRDHNIPVILSTQVSNIRDQLPFISKESKYLSEEKRVKFRRYIEKANSAGNIELIKEALTYLKKAAMIDSFHAETHFGIARCLDLLGRRKEACKEYELARDYDQLRFRASSDFNKLIISMKDDKTVGVVDMEKIFADCSPDSLVGNEIMLDHLHPNSYGYFLMAKRYTRCMQKMGLLTNQDEWERYDTVKDNFLWKKRVITELDELIAERKSEYTKAAWPFVVKTINVPCISEDDTLNQIAEKVVKCLMGWYDAHKEAAQYYEQKSDLINLEREYRALISLVPYNGDPYLELANIYIKQKRMDEAKEVLISSLKTTKRMQASKLLKYLNDHAKERNDLM